MQLPRLAAFLLPLGLVCACADIGQGFPDATTAADSVEDTSAPEDTRAEDLVQPLPDIAPVPDEGEPPPDIEPAEDVDDAPDTDDTEAPEDTEDVPDVQPPDEPLCTPCQTSDDCEGQPCVTYGNDGSFCGGGCDAFVCYPESEGLTTVCKQVSATGVCVGERGCVDGLLTACDAPVPAPEQCDGLDNDCDGVVDEGFDDQDGDQVADCVDPDDDEDGIFDTVDNCPTVKNSAQADLDMDGVGDACDPDIDGDGVANGADCAPNDPTVAASTPEVCNNKDDDCDGVTDEANAAGCTVYFPDADNDGFGQIGGGACLCAPTASHFLVNGGDCDDTTAAVSPEAPEQCDAKDNDCDSVTDEAGALGCQSWLFDNDGDGFHVPMADAKCLCGPDPIGKYTAQTAGDCDDGDASISPGAKERCDGADDNCDGVFDDGCDDDADGYCDANHVFSVTGLVTCNQGAGDCDDNDPQVHPDAPEICDGKDSNCFAGDNKNEGTASACGPQCTPCPVPPTGAAYTCTGVGPDSQCVLACAEGKFCADCTCDGSQELDLGTSVTDARVLYDPFLNTFRVAYFQSGAFRLRAIGPSGSSGNDVISVAGVTKWTDWGLSQNPLNGKFVFGWTAYPDSSIRVGIAANSGTQDGQFLIVPDVPGQQLRQNVAVGWHNKSKTHLVLYDESTSLDLDIRGVQLGQTGAPLGNPFQVVGGAGDQTGASIASRGGDKGYVVAYAVDSGSNTTPMLRFMDHTAGNATAYTLSPAGKSGTYPDIWYVPAMERGIVQWLGADDQYHVRLFGESGVLGGAISLGGPVAAVAGAPQKDALRLFFPSAGHVQMRLLDTDTAQLITSPTAVSLEGPVTKIVGAVSHPLGYTLVVWTVTNGLRGRLIAP